MSNVPTASQTVGPFFSIGLSALCEENIQSANASGNRVTIRGRVLDGDGEPVPDALLEIWQVNDLRLSNSQNEVANERSGILPAGFGRTATNEHGEFKFGTMKPKARRDADGTVHAPHVVVVLFMRGLLRHLVTRIYFGGEATNAEDVVLNLVPSERRETLVAGRAPGGGDELIWDIHLQGNRETVFFEA
jgi:protocatechuate 3,4-dioxygenase alpha subunit